MDLNNFIAIGFICQILSSQTAIALDTSFLSSPVITRNHRRLKGFAYKSFVSLSLVLCGLQCQRQPQCVSVNFLKVSSIDETEGVCELNSWGVDSPIEENKELEYEEGVVYVQFRDMKRDCQLTGCMDEGLCGYNEKSQSFICINHCASSPCANGGSCRTLAHGYRCSCIEGQFTGKQCEQPCPPPLFMAPLGMESGAIKNSQINASSEYGSPYAAHQGRLHFQAVGGLAGGWSSWANDSNRWLQVDLGNVMRVTGIATQGRNAYPQWVKTYKLQYGEDEQNFAFYRRNGDTSDTIFQGNSDSDTVVSHQLDPVTEARYVRVLPVTWYKYPSMRMELYGAC